MAAPQVNPAAGRDVLSPREVADRAGFSYHAILRAIRRGDLERSNRCPATTGFRSTPTSAGCTLSPAAHRCQPYGSLAVHDFDRLEATWVRAAWRG